MYSSVKDTSARWGISERRVRALCAAGKVPGAYQVGRGWSIPSDLEKPADGRYRENAGGAGNVQDKLALVSALRSMTAGEKQRLGEEFAASFVFNACATAGSSLTLRETDLVLRGIEIDDKPLRDQLDASAMAKAWNYALSLAESKHPLDEDVILRLHSLVSESMPEDRGEFRSVAIRMPGSMHSPSLPKDISVDVARLVADYEKSKEPFPVRLARFHVGFESIHPFIEANGRTGRLLLNLELLKAGYPPVDIPFEMRKRYFDAFESFYLRGSISEMASIFSELLDSELDRRILLLSSKPRRRSSLPPFIDSVSGNFAFSGIPVSCDSIEGGHINNSYLIKTDRGAKYVLQRMSSYAFHNIPGLMDNAIAVSSYIASKGGRTLRFVKTASGAYYQLDENGNYWRAYEHIEGLCLSRPEIPEDFYESAVAFGSFQSMLEGFPADSLSITIPGFHDTPARFAQLHGALDADSVSRASQAGEELSFAFARENESGALMSMLEGGELPLRVTHNDTKLNNVVLDSETRKAVCVIDLDTVMPGLSAFDFGDAIRAGASSAPEDEKNLDRVRLNLYLFRLFARGFIKSCPGLTQKEKSVLPLGAKLITLECGVRFLTDYLQGDRYFSVSYPEQNLDRARTQFKLVADMESRWDEMRAIVREESERFT